MESKKIESQEVRVYPWGWDCNIKKLESNSEILYVVKDDFNVSNISLYWDKEFSQIYLDNQQFMMWFPYEEERGYHKMFLDVGTGLAISKDICSGFRSDIGDFDK